MSQEAEPLLKVAPFVRGVTTRERAIIRRADAPSYLGLSIAELGAVDELAQSPVTVSEFLGRHLGGQGDLDFKTAVSLVMRLHQGGFIADSSAEITARLREYSGKSTSQAGGRLRRVVSTISTVLDLPLVSFDRSDVHPIFRVIGRAISSMPAMLAYIALVIGLSVYAGVTALPDQELYADQIGEPLQLLARTFFAFSLAASWLAFLQMAALSGAGARFVGGSLRLTGLCVVRLAVRDEDVLMLPKATMLRYHVLTLLTPWVSALVCYLRTDVGQMTSIAGLFAGTFSLLGLFMLCPLYRSPLVKIAEGWLATLNVLDRANAYLATGLFTQLFKREGAAKRGSGGVSHQEHATNLWITAFACISIVWLYGMSLLFFDALIGAVPDLWVNVLAAAKQPVRGGASALILAVLAGAVAVPVLRLVAIPFQNLAVLASVPLRRARRGIGSFYDQKLPPSVAIAQFLREIPILADLSDDMLNGLMQVLKFKAFGQGQTIIRRGEPGEEFFILADGQAQVIIGGQGVPEEVVDVLSPGDSFGEIALVERVTRTATIRALTPVKTLVLQRQAFDKLFPEGSEQRARLTSMIRQVKLVLESQALSHLAPRQIRELLRFCQPRTFAAGEFLIKENTVGDAAFLVESGEVQVVKESYELASLGRGELVGAISLIKDIKRTASVRARTDVTCLAIDKATFLKMCMSNVFVALLVSDLSDKQIAQTQKAG